MRKLALAIAFIILFSGCYKSKEPEGSMVKATGASTVLEHYGMVYNKLYELPNNKQIYYNDYKNILFKSGDNHILLNNTGKDESASSSPVLSPNRKNIAYISPYEFELNGNVYVFDTDTEIAKKVIQVDIKQEDSAKVVKWLDDDRLLVIIGYGKGTVSRGGNLYLYNLKTDELKTLKRADEKEEIVDVNTGKGELLLDVITWDEEFIKYTTKQVRLKHE
ncbi:MAG TPA: DUF4652 domain-containing protein [Pseudobacteroides sp.]|uniref:DUF4652 domain-containing protein n=1 Tax=Pseudobacteroides sp. TaxID=1968840 RepID=UPI002F937906